MKPFESIGESLAGRLSLESYPAQGFPSWKVSHLLKQLKLAVEMPKVRRTGEALPKLPERPHRRAIKIRRADLEAFAWLVRFNLSHSSKFSRKASWRGVGGMGSALNPSLGIVNERPRLLLAGVMLTVLFMISLLASPATALTGSQPAPPAPLVTTVTGRGATGGGSKIDVLSQNSFCASPSSFVLKTGSVIVADPSLGKPVLVSPDNNTWTTDDTPTFKWENGANATSHRLVIDNDPNFADGDNVYDNANLGGAATSCTIESELENGTYYWKVIAISGAAQEESDVWTFTFRHPIDYVDTLIGVGSGTGTGDDDAGFCYPSVGVPFGMTQWAPQALEETGNDKDVSVPYKGENSIAGFRGSHFPSGSRMRDYASITIHPQAGTQVETLKDDRYAWMTITENSPAYFACNLLDDDYYLDVEMTATMHTGFFKVTYENSGTAYVLVDAHSQGTVDNTHASENEIWAKNVQYGFNDGHNYGHGFDIVGYSVVRFNRSFSSEVSGCLAHADFSVNAGGSILVKVGTSFISYEQARANLDNEIPDWDFDGVRSETEEEWNRELSKIEVEGENERQMTIFYTSLYHCMLAPRVSSENDNYYSVFDGENHTCTGYQFYNDFSLWDTFRAEHPLLIIIQPDRVEDMCQSLVDMYEQGGWMPKWPNPGYSSVMIATHADSIIAESYLKGLNNFDIESAYNALMKNATVPTSGTVPNTTYYEARAGLTYYTNLGYVPADIGPPPGSNMGNNEGTSCTLEYAYDDWCIAQMAENLGKENDYELLMERAHYYKNVYDPSAPGETGNPYVGYVRGRNENGSWSDQGTFDPTHIDPQPYDYITEGDPYQYTWFVPHDVHGLIYLMGGRDNFNNKLDHFFEKTDFNAGWQKYYNHANEPVHHVVYLYDWSGEPWKTQEYVRAVMEGQYWTPGVHSYSETYGYNGLTGNEDCGQMSAWCVFSAMGFYPVCPTQLTYEIGSPIFDRVTIHLDNSYYGGDFVIEARNVSRDNKYIQSATLNGENLDKPWFTHDNLSGGHLVFEMDNEPNYSWGSDTEDAPPSMFTVSLLEPENAFSTTDNTPVFKWENAFVAQNYEIWIDDDSDFSSPEIKENTIENTYTPTTELATGDYWWKVRAYKDGEAKPFSSKWTFHVSEPGWWNLHWPCRRPITIENHPTDYQIKVVIPNTIAKSDYPSIRFLENDNSGLLSYWIERNEGSYLNVAWVRRLENSDNTIYMYYGNSSASSAENGDKTFMFFDDFGSGVAGSGGSDWLNHTKWGHSPYSLDVRQYALQAKVWEGHEGKIWHGEGEGLTTEEEGTRRVIETRMKNVKTFRGGILLEGPGWGDHNETACIFEKGGGEYRFWSQNFPGTVDGSYLSQQNHPGDVWYILSIDLYGDSKNKAKTHFYWGNDNANYRQLVEESQELTHDWAPPDDRVNVYALRVWDDSSEYYFDWFFVRKYTDPEPSTTVENEETIDKIPPAAFKLLTPENGATTTNNMPTLTWQASSDSGSGLDHYEVWLNGNNVDNVSDIATAYTIFPQSYGSHKWYIVAVDVASNKRQSENFTFTILDSGETISDVPAGAILLRDNWDVQSSHLVSESGEIISNSGFTPVNWYSTSVPATVLTALVRNGVYPNPYVGMNNMRIPDSNDTFNTDYDLLKYSHIPGVNPWKDPYWYRTEFFIPSSYAGKEIWLNFNGINYRAAVWLNGHKIADNEDMVGMFRRFKFNITSYANPGENNYLAVKINNLDYPGRPADPQLDALGSFGPNGGYWANPYPDNKEIGKNVTMQCALGWDWIPEVHDRNMGIWQDVYVNATGPVDIRNPHVITDLPLPDTSSVNVTVSAELVNATENVQSGVLKGSIRCDTTITFENSVVINPGETVEVVHQLEIENPHLWWPNTYGEQYLYELSLRFENNKVGDNVFDNETTTFGVREITTEVPTDKARVFSVNGENIFLKGGAWVPDMMLNWDSKRYDDEIRLLAGANNNIVRIWGGGVTPPDEFFEACDRYGLLVWHDFWITGDCNGRFGGSHNWPLDSNLFFNCAADTVKRIRNHPSLLVWVGGNEYYPRQNLYENLRDNILPELDGTRPLLLSSDGGQGNPSWEPENPAVYSGGPWYWCDSEYYFDKVRTNDQWKFKDETGSPSLPPLSSLKRFIPNLTPDLDEPFPLNDTWGYHDACENNTGNGQYGVYHDAIENRYGSPTTLEDYALKAQLVNADVYRAIFEAANHRMWAQTSGVLLWKSQSAWPSVMWQLYDWYLLPNAGYYYTQSACEPLHVQLNDNLAVSVINTYHEAKNNLTVTTKVYDHNMSPTWQNTKVVSVGGNCYTEILGTVQEPAGPMYFVWLEMKDNENKVVSRNFYWLSDTDDFTGLQSLPTVDVNTSVKVEYSGDETVLDVTVKNPTNDLAFFMCLKVTSSISREEVLPTFWSSNYFSLLPEENRVVTARFKTTDLVGNPVIELSGINVLSQELEITTYPTFETPPSFVKYEGNPIMEPRGDGWEKDKVYNPSVIVDNNILVDENIFHMLYRAESGDGIDKIGYASSANGITFGRLDNPVLVPSEGYDINGCEDPRVVKFGNTYYMTYTGDDGGVANVCLAKSTDLKNWTKLGETVQSEHSWNNDQIKAGALVPQKIGGYYYMYFMGQSEAWKGRIGLARATDINNVNTWEDFLGQPVMEPRPGDYFDDTGVEPGAAYVLEDAILLIYNGWMPDPDYPGPLTLHQYIHRTGWALFSRDNLAQLIDRCDNYIIEEYVEGQKNICFSESICYHNGKWYIHYGMQDDEIGVATTRPAAPSQPDLAAEDDTGISDTDNITSQTTNLTFSGTAEANSTVELFDGATSKGTTVANGSGNWSIDNTLAEGTHSITAKATDAAGNTSDASAVTSVTVDTTAPTVSTYNPADDATEVPVDNNLVLTFNETAVKGTGNIVIYKSDDIVFETIAVTDAKVTVNGATVTINPAGTFANSTGYYVQIAETCFDDLAGNSYAGITNKTTWNFTTGVAAAGPTVTVSSDGTSTNSSPITFTMTFSESVTGLTADGITVTNGTKGTLSGSGTIYTIPVTPTEQGAVTCQVTAGAAQDADGNNNSASNTASVTYDTTAPTVTVSPTGTSTNSSPITFTITFSESVTGLTVGEITVTNGTKGALSGSGKTYTLPVTPTADGAVTCQVIAGAAQDAAGNNNSASNTASVTYVSGGGGGGDGGGGGGGGGGADFSISVSPTNGEVVQGGSTTATVTITQSNNYSKVVTLTASGQPGGVTVTFSSSSNPSQGDTEALSVTIGPSSLNITMKINVSRSATAGTYTITITGKGADGKTHETTFTLTITPVPVEIPVSGVNTIAPYWRVVTPFTITATASDNDGHVTDVVLYYRYSANNSSWGSWTSFGTDDDNSDGWSWSFTAPENDGYYEFFSIARDNDSNQESTKLLAEARCGVDRTVPSAPQLVSPTNGVRIDTATPTFDWADVSDFAGVTYEFVVDDDSDFSSPVLSKVGLTTSTYQLTIQENLADKKYYWRVRAVDKAGNIGVWADAWSVVIRGTPPPAVSIGAILVGENAVADFTQHNIDVMTVRIVAENNLLDVKVTVDILAAPPAEVPAPIMSVYAFFDISTNVEAGGIREATVEFKISKSWIEQNGIDEGTIKLLRYHNGEWQELSTRLVSSDSEYLYFEATTPGFSLFVATGEKISPSPPPPVAPSGLPLLPLVVLSTIAVGMGGFIAHRLLTRRSKYFTMLRRLKQAVVGPRARRVGEPLVEPPVRVRKQVSQAELAELKRLERIARERKRKFAR